MILSTGSILQLVDERLPRGAPGFMCPQCQCVLKYSAVRHASDQGDGIDLSDHYVCPAGCGTYERDRATHRLRCLAPN